MAQFDVFRATDGGLLVDCQSDALAYLATRLTAPLMPLSKAPEGRPRINPVFDIFDEPHVLVTQFAASIRKTELRRRVADLTPYRLEIVSAFDVLLTGV
ncbi:hypothetical protein ASG29_01990 [Sphingomonas sp. Leaf412]|uniref:CcdB family protein n=1 Tax=Sphingomonas sp. Leaf412 TaxID=1736370 RepID=UPI0006FEA8AD|nr:CcdB family protein [Sphingomonas sp. Leaf412]KQT34941.1 hypothetical protein ASG29_01990 [Sphingomonas sp. Leaf412]